MCMIYSSWCLGASKKLGLREEARQIAASCHSSQSSGPCPIDSGNGPLGPALGAGPAWGKAVGSGMGWTVEVLEGPRPYAQRRVRNPEVSPGAQMCAAAARAFSWGCQPPAGMAPTHRPARLRASPGQPGQVASSICQVESSVPSGASAPELSP